MRISGLTIPENKRLEVGLTTLYGIGRPLAQSILDKLGIDRGAKPKDLSEDKENALRKEVESRKIEGELKRDIAGNIKRLKDIKAYRGLRHMKSLPSRGQRTKTNSRTRRGNTRKTMGSGRKKVEKK
ncbi:MAG: 30S ribosomal protein S13 [Parcubacteria group bacterium GW2011_GWF2_38_76]|nr:MAG: 30S ribosomal protein S13 [Parcubacteria group bacterium GW2011_GWF2_38_76]HBM46015.1 30S ribosomal protein S13 [Patescibacteria group bacterium]